MNMCLRAYAGSRQSGKARADRLFRYRINLSRATLYFESVVELYKCIANETGIDTKYVPIEITESAAIDNS